MLQSERLEELFFAALGDADMFESLMEFCKRHQVDPVPYINKAEAKYEEFRAAINGPRQIVSNRKFRMPLHLIGGNPL